MQSLSCLALLAVLTAALSLNGAAALDETAAQRDARLRWWREARFGMFVHWGPVGLKGTEIGWSRGAEVPIDVYDQLYREFNPTNFNADTWAKVARDSGMKYLVLTSKHHDGFCLWASKLTPYDIMNTPFRRDVVKELAAACRRHGLVFCTYHSICDWHHPDYPLGSPGGRTQKPEPYMDRYNLYLKNQLVELLQNYGRIGIMWFDGEWEKPWTHQRGVDLYQWVRRFQPRTIINNRVGIGRGGMDGGTAAGAFGGDYDTPEQRVGKFQNDRPWESCITICHQWAWKPNDNMKSLKECLQTLVYCAGGDGNLLFNVGPMPSGEIEPRQVERLREMGVWLKSYGESIYKTRGGPFKPGPWGASTHRGNRIYLHVFRWPDRGLQLPAIGKKVKSAKALMGGQVEFKETLDGMVLNVPPESRQEIDTLIELKLDGSAADIAPVAAGGRSLTEGKPARASNVYQNQSGHNASKACDGDRETRWATDGGTKQAWIEVDLGKTETFSRVVIDEWADGGKRVQSFKLEVKEGEAWRALHYGTTLGSNWELKLVPTVGRSVRLSILEATDGPTINEFEVYRE